jgi:hypothetical protein
MVASLARLQRGRNRGGVRFAADYFFSAFAFK